MDEQLKKDAHLLCEKIRKLTRELDISLQNIPNDTKKQNIKIEIKEKENKKILKPAPVAGRKGTKWDPTIISWKDSLRRPW